jgi:hypothetical protein
MLLPSHYSCCKLWYNFAEVDKAKPIKMQCAAPILLNYVKLPSYMPNQMLEMKRMCQVVRPVA